MNRLPAKYVDVKSLAPGKNADVWSAVNANLNRPCFLKLYTPDPGDEASALHEPKLLQQVSGATLARIYDADILSGGSVLLEMELLERGSLNDASKEANDTGEYLSLHRVLDLVQDTLTGLSHLHKNGYVHRDIKPANVMRSDAAGRIGAVVTDLGLCSRLGGNGRAVASQHARLYRPPEAWEGNGYSPASDLYQVGVVMFQLLGGKLDFGLSILADADLADVITNFRLCNLCTLPPYVPRPMLKLLRQILCKESDRIVQAVDAIIEVNNCRSAVADAGCQRSVEREWKVTVPARSPRLLYHIESTDTQTHSVQVYTVSKDAKCRRKGDAVVIKHQCLVNSNQFHSTVKLTR